MPPPPLPSSLLWLDDIACVDLDVPDYFVEAGHVIEEGAYTVCRGCPVRRDCITHAYERNISGGYFGGLSPGQRRDMSLTEALSYIEDDEALPVPDPVEPA